MAFLDATDQAWDWRLFLEIHEVRLYVDNMAKKFGFDSKSQRARGASARQRTETVSRLKLTSSFKEATRAAANAAWDKNLSVPCVVDGRIIEIGPDKRFKD